MLNSNPFDGVRLNSIFQGMGASSGPETPDSGVIMPRGGDMNRISGSQTPYDVIARMQQLYQPQHQMSDAFLKQIQNMPDIQNYHPSNARKVGAVLAGLGTGGPAGIAGGQVVGYHANPAGAMEVSQNYVRQPFNQQMNDWTNKTNAAGAGANIEQSSNAANRQFAEQTVRNELTDKLRDTQQQNADTNATKNAQIYETKLADLQRKVDESQVKAAEWEKKYQADQTNRDTINKLNQARLDATIAMAELERARKEKEHKETIDSLNKRHADEMKAAEARLEEVKRQHDITQLPTTRTTTVQRDSSGQPISSTVRTAKGQLPRAAVSHVGDISQNNPPANNAPKEGDTQEIPGYPGTEQTFRAGRWIRTK